MKKRILAMTVLFVISTVLAWSTGQAAEEGTQSSAKPYEVLFWEHGPWTRAEFPDPATDFVAKAIREKYNIDIKIMAAPTDGADAKLNAMIAAGEMPDMIQNYWGMGSVLVQQYIDQGVIIPIDDYIKYQAYLKTYLTSDEWTYLSLNGKKYALAQPRPIQNWLTIWTRKDWLDNLGLKVPTTVQELEIVAKAFTFDDPDGNGKDDTYGFTAQTNFGMTNAIFAPFGAFPGHNFIRVENNKVVFDAFSPQAKQALEWWKSQIDAGVVDPNWATNRFDNMKESIVQGKIGLPVWEFQMLRSGPSQSFCWDAMQTTTPEAEWIQVPAVKGPFGNYTGWDGALVDCKFMFTRQIESEEGKSKALFAYLNDVMNPAGEMYKTQIYGIEGVTYENDDQGKRIKRMSPPELKWLSYYVVFRRGDEGYFWYYKQEPRDLWSKLMLTASQPRISNVTPLAILPSEWADLDIYLQEMHMKFATGQEPFSKWEDFVNTANTTYGLSKISADVTAQMKTLGAIK